MPSATLHRTILYLCIGAVVGLTVTWSTAMILTVGGEGFGRVHAILVAAALGLSGVAIAQREAELQEASTKDALTGLFNRRYFEERFRLELLRAKRHGLPTAVALIDVDDLKGINDNLGHAMGDVVLRHVACVLSASVRATDVVCRLGGDEFVIVLVHTSADEALRLAQRLRTAVRAEAGTDAPTVSISVGIAEAPRGPLHPANVVHAADQALLRAKAEGRNCVRLAPVSG